MNTRFIQTTSPRPAPPSSRGFTLIELLVVISIIALLIAILLPSLQGARAAAKNVHTQGTLKAVGDSLELFRNDNERDVEFNGTDGYPPSAMGEDQTEPGAQNIFGAQWLVRYLAGKDFRGYVPKRAVPAELRNEAQEAAGAEQVDWYDDEAFNDAPLERVGPYLDPKVIRPSDLAGEIAGGTLGVDDLSVKQPVMQDTFGFPIIYYLADQTQAARPNAALASFDGTHPGIYTHQDNALFTGYCNSGACVLGGWKPGTHHIENFGSNDPVVSDETIDDDKQTFPCYIMNKETFRSTGGLETDPVRPPTVIPYRRDTFILISPGRDGTYGTSDDVTNF